MGFLIYLLKITTMKKILFIALVLFVIGCSKEKTGKVKYEILSDPYGFTVNYTDEDGSTRQVIVTQAFWNKEFIGKAGDNIEITVQADSLNTIVATRVCWNGSVIAKTVASGGFNLSTTSVTLPK